MKKVIHVAVGVIENKQGEILIAKRADSAHQGGLWEFPGGKVEAGESVATALTRELQEELAINANRFLPLIQIHHDYDDKSVFLDVLKVTDFSGTPCGNEGQPIRWVPPAHLTQFTFPAANKPIVNAITLPNRLLITGEYTSVENFSRELLAAITQNIDLVQLRLDKANDAEYQLCRKYAEEIASRKNIRLTFDRDKVNNFLGLEENIHLSAKALMAVERISLGGRKNTISATCHNKEEIIKANALALDYICLSPVKPTKTDPNAELLGWQRFAQLTKLATMPVFALGGMTMQDIEIAQECGGQGVAVAGDY